MAEVKERTFKPRMRVKGHRRIASTLQSNNTEFAKAVWRQNRNKKRKDYKPPIHNEGKKK